MPSHHTVVKIPLWVVMWKCTFDMIILCSVNPGKVLVGTIKLHKGLCSFGEPVSLPWCIFSCNSNVNLYFWSIWIFLEELIILSISNFCSGKSLEVKR